MTNRSITPYKKCRKCQEEFPRTLEFFAAERRCRDGLQARCRTCQYASTKECDARNLEARRARLKRYYNNHKRRFSKWRHEYFIKNRETIRAGNRRWRARRLAAEGSHTANDIENLVRLQKGRCWWCGKKLRGGKFHVDHRIPLSKGGSDAPANLVIACPPCNLSKKDKMPEDFAGRLL